MTIGELVKRDDKQLIEALEKVGLSLEVTKEGKTKIINLQHENEKV